MSTVLAGLLGLVVTGWTAPSLAAPVSATLGLEVGTLPGASFTGSGSGTSTTLQLTLPTGLFAGMVSAPVTGAAPITSIKLTLTGNGVGSFTGAALAGPMPVLGGAKVLGSFGMGQVTLVKVPFARASSMGAITGGVGVGGMTTLTGVVSMITWDSWSAGVKKITGLTSMYTYHFATGMNVSMTSTLTATVTETRTGSDMRAANGGGRVTLVSPTRVFTQITAPIAVWTTLTIDVVPEPGASLLLATGAAVLLVLGGKKRRG